MEKIISLLLSAALLGVVPLAVAQGDKQGDKYPTRAIRLIVPFSAGSQTDALSRLLGQKLTQSLGEQVVIDNRAGAGGMLAMQMAANANPDGHTLLFHSSAYSIGPHLYPKMNVNIARDFQAISLVASTPHVLVTSPQLGPKSLKEFLDFARSKGDLNWSHAGIGSSTHLVGEKFMLETKLRHTGIPFKGAPEALTDAISMRVSLFFAAVGHAAPFVQDGRVIPLAVTSKDRSPALPNVPTVAESGMAGFDYEVWFLIAAPGKTPKPIVGKLSSDVRRALGLNDFKRTLDTMGSVGRPMTPDEAQAYALKEYETLGKVIIAAKVPIN